MIRRFAASALPLLAGLNGAVAGQAVCPTQVPDDRAVHIRSEADVAIVRERLYQYVWGQPALPLTDAGVAVDAGVHSPVSGTANLARVDLLRTADDTRGGESIIGEAWHFVPATRNARLVIVHNGHVSTNKCVDQFRGDLVDPDGSGVQMTINALVAEGFDVLAISMPLFARDQCGDEIWGTYNVHDRLFSDQSLQPRSGTPVRYFLDPTLRSLNYLLAQQSFKQVAMVGLSGGGWTTTIYAALDPRVELNFPVAGSLPLYLRNLTLVDKAPTRTLSQDVEAEKSLASCRGQGDTEQHIWGLYSIAGLPDLYLLGAYGSGRKQVQILNRHDDCCWGQEQLAEPAHYERDLRAYERRIQRALRKLDGGGSFQVHIDDAATRHQISRSAVNDVIMARLGSTSARIADRTQITASDGLRSD